MPAVNHTTLLEDYREQILEICARHGAGNVRVFGSYARGESRPDSDLDLLVEIVGPTTMWWPGGIVADLEDLLGIQIDVTTENSLSKYIKDVVLEEAVPL